MTVFAISQKDGSTRVLIIARTRVSDRDICLGGLDLDTSRCLRLSTATGSNFTYDAPFSVGSIWQLTFTPRPNCLPPHIEDVHVQSFHRIELAAAPGRLVLDHAEKLPVWRGGPGNLFDGLLTPDNRAGREFAGSLYVFTGNPAPAVSLGYWIPDRDLRVTTGRRRSGRTGQDVYYIDQSGPDTTVRIVHSGLTPLPSVIPSGSVVSLSLARWWTPANDSDQRPRCTLQICDVLATNG